MNEQDPHANQPVLMAGTALEEAEAALILLHGRGAGAEDILGLAHELDLRGFTYLAPQAAGNTWYPMRFIAPLESNQPWLDSALGRIASIISSLQNNGITLERTGLLGFSQGACLALEYAARNPGRYAAIAGLSGGLIGPPGMAFEHSGSMQDTPVFLGCSDPDPHIPTARVLETAAVFERLEAVVETRLYPGLGHTVNQEEIEAVRAMLAP